MDLEEVMNKIDNNIAILYLIANAVDSGQYFPNQLPKALFEVCDALEDARECLESHIENLDEAL